MRSKDSHHPGQNPARGGWLWAVAAVASVWACAGNTDVVSPGSGGFGINGSNDEEDPDNPARLGQDGQGQAGLPGGLNPAAGGPEVVEEAEVDWPQMDFMGNGNSTCKGNSYATKAQVATSVDAGKLDLNLYNATIQAGGKAQDKANSELQKSTGITSYTRMTAEQRSTFKAQGVKMGSYAIFAMGVTKQRQGHTFNFDKPLPVYPMPGSEAAFQNLSASGAQSWTAHVTGNWTFDVTITLQVLSVSGGTVQLKLTTDIAQDQPGAANHRHLYEVFPVPREAVYTLSVVDQDVRQMVSTSWFLGDENCSGRPEQVTMTYNLCKKVTSKKTDTYPCN